MSDIHKRIEAYGRQGALDLTSSDAERRALDAALEFLSDEDPSLGFLYSGWCQTGLPHRRLDDDQIWLLETTYVRLMVEPGSVKRDGVPARIGVPYGSRARLILLFLQTEAIKTNSREIELGKSLRSWLKRLNVPIGGKSMRDVKEQATRISRCRMTFEIKDGNKIGLINQNIVDTALFTDEHDGALLETVRLSESFFDQLKRHPVPLQESAIRAISNNSQALDIYFWLVYRLHERVTVQKISWPALKAQFGASYTHMRNFKIRFRDALQIALAIYPEAKVGIDEDGVTLFPSASPVPRRLPGKTRSRGIIPAE